MSRKRRMTSWLRRALGRRSLEAEMREEMEFHRAARVADLVSGGMSEKEAERRARIEFGGVDRYQEECRNAWGFQLPDELRADIKYAGRGIRKSPGFSMAAIAILALAMGANSVLFTLYNNYVLKPLPIRGAGRHFDLAGRTVQAQPTPGWTASEMAALREATPRQIEGLYTADMIQVLLLEPVQRQVFVTVASGNYFGLTGGSPRIGRTFSEAEERQPLAVLSDAGWKKLMAADPAPLGKTLRIRSVAYTIAGVMGPEFTGAQAAVPELWVPSGMSDALRPRPAGAGPGDPRFGISVLLRPGIAPTEAQAVLTAAAARFARPPEERVASVELHGHHSLIPEEDAVPAAMAMVFGVFLMVLLIACANLATLYLSRAASRTHEIAMRISLGASRWRIVRQLLTESTLIALAGAAAGLALAASAIRQVQDYLFSTVMAAGLSILPVTLDWRVCLYSAAMGMLAGLAFGLLPALAATSQSLAVSAKREHPAFAGRIRPHRMRNLLIGGQVAASLVMLILAGVLVRNIQRLNLMDPGYDIDRVMDVRTDRLSAALMEHLARVESVSSVTALAQVPLGGQRDQHAALVDGVSIALAFNFVDERYFEVLSVPVAHGRFFTRHEAESRARVTVISAATARKLWHTTAGSMPSVIGKTIELPHTGGDDPGTPGVYQVIGVAPDLLTGWFFQGADATAMYLPAAAGSAAVSSAMVRIAGNPAKARAAIRKACAEFTEAPAGCDPASLREGAAMQRFPFQAAAAVAGALGTLALLLTGIGLYGVVSYSVVQRRREIGVRMALGALPRQVMGRVLSEAWWCVAGGLAAGLPVCLALSKLAASSVFQLRTFDAASYVLVPLLLAGISLAACFGPARRASRMDPVRSLREE